MKLYTIQDACKKTGKPESTFKARAYSLDYKKIAGRWLFTEEQFNCLLDDSLHRVGKRAKKDKKDDQ